MSHLIDIAGTHYRITGGRLAVVHHGDRTLDVDLGPTFDGEPIPIACWEEAGPNVLVASLGRFGTAHLAERFDRLAFWIETPVKQFREVGYLSDGMTSGEHWRTFVSDEYERLWPKKVDVRIPISSAYAGMSSPDGDVPGGMNDPDDLPGHWIWNVHVRAFAFAGRRRWLGLAIPGPWGIGVTRLSMARERFALGIAPQGSLPLRPY